MEKSRELIQGDGIRTITEGLVRILVDFEEEGINAHRSCCAGQWRHKFPMAG
jgi:hypothetical protein